MSDVSATDVKNLREQTGAGVMEAKKALADAKGDAEQAAKLLAERGLLKAAKKGGREASEGLVQSYVHGDGRIGVLLELNCETDFVARNDEFQQLAKDLVMHIAAQGVPIGSDRVKTEIFGSINDPNIEKKMKAGIELLMKQPFVKDQSKTIQEVITAAISTLGENIKVARFTRYELGE